MSSTRSTIELLAPAGDWESLRAAVANGANAVYFGLSQFNARARATNFTLEELPEVMQFLHGHNVRGFVAFNTLIFTGELPAAQDYIRAIARAQVDAVIVQDLGLVRLIRKVAPSLPIHASTQMTLTEPAGIEFVKQLGIERVVLARELSLEDIRKVTARTTMPVEVFVHGALCVAYSGQCLTSEALGGRSANRGQCAQACRLPYEMIVDGKTRDLGDRAYLLSPQDLAAYERIQPLIESGVISFKIEGRLKGGPYVAATTRTYRQAIDAAVAGQTFQLERKEELALAQTFSRGFTPGFLDGVNHQKLVRGRFPKSRGIRAGRVLDILRNVVRIELCEAIEDLLKPGDGVVFDLGKPEEKEPGGRIWTVRPIQTPDRKGQRAGTVVEVTFEKGTIDLSAVPAGCDVWRTDDPTLRKSLEATYARDRVCHRVPLIATLSGRAGGALALRLRDDEGHQADSSWEGPLERAQKRTSTREELFAQLARLGDTAFELQQLDCQLEEGLLIPRSVLNDLRRKATEELTAYRQHSRKCVLHPGDGLSELRKAQFVDSNSQTDLNLTSRLTVMVRNLSQLDAVVSWQPPHGMPRPEIVYCDFEDLRLYKEAVSRARAHGMPVGLATLRISKPGEEGFHSLVTRAEPDIVLIRSLAALQLFREQLPQATLIGDYSLNTANDLTASLFHESGLQRLVPSFDLNWDQFQSLLQHANPRWFEPVIHQHMPMFHMEHCVFAAFLSKGKDHRDCGRPCETHRVELRDRTGVEFPVHPDTGCRNTVFNSVAQSAAEYVERMQQLGVRWFRIDLLRESEQQVHMILERYSRVLTGQTSGRETWKQLHVLNQLGVTRGTLQLA